MLPEQDLIGKKLVCVGKDACCAGAGGNCWQGGALESPPWAMELGSVCSTGSAPGIPPPQWACCETPAHAQAVKDSVQQKEAHDSQ